MHIKYLILRELLKRLEEGKITDLQFLNLVTNCLTESV